MEKPSAAGYWSPQALLKLTVSPALGVAAAGGATTTVAPAAIKASAKGRANRRRLLEVTTFLSVW